MKKNEFRYDYYTLDKEKIGYVLRITQGDKKSVIPYFNREGDNTYKKGIPDALNDDRPLFGLESIKDWREPIYFVEGEKCAKAFHYLGFQSVTTLGGCQGYDKSDYNPLNKALKIILVPDNDENGFIYSQNIYRKLFKESPSTIFKALIFPKLPLKGDVCDFLKENYEALYGWDELSPIENSFKEALKHSFKKDIDFFIGDIPIDWTSIQSIKGLNAYSFRSLKQMNLPDRQALLKPWLLQNSINMVFADRRIGKTYFCLSCAIALCEGGKFIKYETDQPRKVLYLDGEMQASLLRDRLSKLVSNEALVEQNLYIVTPDCQIDRDMPNLAKADDLEEIDEIIHDIKPDVIFVDNLSTFIRSGNENDGESFLPVQEWAIRQRSAGRAVVFVHHTNKGGQQRGSSRKEDVMDVVINLKRPDDYCPDQEGARFLIEFTKARNLFGEDIKIIEANLKAVDDNHEWEWKSALGKYGNAIELLKDGYTQKEVCELLEIPKTTAHNWKKKAEKEGLL